MKYNVYKQIIAEKRFYTNYKTTHAKNDNEISKQLN